MMAYSTYNSFQLYLDLDTDVLLDHHVRSDLITDRPHPGRSDLSPRPQSQPSCPCSPVLPRHSPRPSLYLQVTSSPLTQKVQFLESKGLSSSEIERALHVASSSASTVSDERPPTTQDERLGPGSNIDHSHNLNTEYGTGYGDYDQGYTRGGSGYGTRAGSGAGFGYGQGTMQRPELPRRDWRDYFVRLPFVSSSISCRLLIQISLPDTSPTLTSPDEHTASSTLIPDHGRSLRRSHVRPRLARPEIPLTAPPTPHPNIVRTDLFIPLRAVRCRPEFIGGDQAADERVAG